MNLHYGRTRLKQFLTVSDASFFQKKVPVLRTVIGDETYSLLRDLRKPQESKKSCVDPVAIFENHFKPSENIIYAKRIPFWRLVAGQSLIECLALLKIRTM